MKVLAFMRIIYTLPLTSHDYQCKRILILHLIFKWEVKCNRTHANNDNDDDDGGDNLFLPNDWYTKGVNPCLQPGRLLEIIIANVRYARNKI